MGDGRILVTGQFASYNGQPAGGIVRLNANGTRDASFDTSSGAGSSAALPNYGYTQPKVDAVQVQPDGRLLLAGTFDSFNGAALPGLARLNADGSVDASFAVPVANASQASINGSNQSFLLQERDGSLLLAGNYVATNGATAGTIFKLTPDAQPPGAVSPTFTPGAGTDSTVRAIVYQPDGRALIGGAFTSYRGVSRNGVARVNPDGSLDASFDPGSGADDTVNALLLLPNGQVLVGGDFSSFNGVARNGAVRLNADGRVDPAFDAGLEAGGLPPVTAAASGGHPLSPDPVPKRMVHAKGTNTPGFVSGLALDANGKLVLAGLFQRTKGAPTPAVTRVLPAAGASDPDFDHTAGAPDGRVKAVSLQKDGKIVIAGLFDRTGNAGRKNVARLNTDGTPDTGFNPGAGAEGGAVNALLVQDDGNIVLGGEFLRTAGQPRNRLARLTSNGDLDTAFDPGAGADGAVRALAPAPNNAVLVGGDFKNLDGLLAAAFSRVKSDGRPDPPSWLTPPAGPTARWPPSPSAQMAARPWWVGTSRG